MPKSCSGSEPQMYSTDLEVAYAELVATELDPDDVHQAAARAHPYPIEEMPTKPQSAFMAAFKSEARKLGNIMDQLSGWLESRLGMGAANGPSLSAVAVTGPHEYTYDPVSRYIALAKTLRQPRGAKSTEHLEILRQSDPCYGSLAPRKDRPSAHEYTYDPVPRYIALAKTLRQPRGAKTVAHLAELRKGGHFLGLDPRAVNFAARPNANPNFDDEWQQLAALPVLEANSSMRQVSSFASDLWRRLEEDDQLRELPSHLWAGPRRGPALAGRPSRLSDDLSDTASEFSAARTALERSSNDTCASLADMEDIINNKAGFDSGEWGPSSVPASPKQEAAPGRLWNKPEATRQFSLPLPLLQNDAVDSE